MEHITLYRKYRPKNFSEVAGQNVPVNILKNAIASNKISHAYLLYGPRGTGKTSIAKMFARAVNCEHNDNGIQCESCANCISSNQKECVDIIEIDAASNNGVDEIRELKNKINFVPSELKYKVYIIDEVHMLSIGAFNALLKTLEEPPEHIIFVLATTELQKVPTTIISRCQTLEFKKINKDQMKKRLQFICDTEKINIEDAALDEIVRYSNGGLRDAIGLLEKSVAYSNNSNISLNIIKEISGNISVEELNKFIKEFENKNIEYLLDKINEFYNNGVDLIKVVNELIENTRDQIVESKNYNSNKCSIIGKLDNLLTQMKVSDNSKILLEIGLINLLNDNNTTTNNDSNGENVSKSINITNETKNPIKEENTNIKNSEKIDELNTDEIYNLELKKIRISNTLCRANKQIISEIRNDWNKLMDYAFDEKYGNIARLLNTDFKPVAASDEYVILVTKIDSLSNKLNIDIDNVESLLEKVLNKKIKAISTFEKDWKEITSLYVKDKNSFKYIEEKNSSKTSKKTLKEKAKELFED